VVFVRFQLLQPRHCQGEAEGLRLARQVSSKKKKYIIFF
jgi:hypothetical protein